MNESQEAISPTPRIKWGLARLLTGLDTEMFENGVPEPWKSVGQRIRVTDFQQRSGVLESEVRQIPGLDCDELIISLAQIDATREYESRVDYQAASLPSAVPFPVLALPDVLARYVSEGARAVHCPLDYLGSPLLGFLGAAIGGTRRLIVKPGWPEQPNLYLLVVGASGSKKSPAASFVSRFAEARSRQFVDDYSSKVKEYESLHSGYEDDLSDYRSHRRRHPGSPTSGNRPQAPDKPILSRAIVDDTTVEALQRTLYENPRGVVMHRDELTGLLQGLNQYKGGRGSDGSFFLSAWSGKSITVDRKSLASPYHIPRPVLTIVGGIPPGVLSSVLGSMRLEDGMSARFLVSYPNLMLQEISDEIVSPESVGQMEGLLEGLYGLEPQSSEGHYDPRLVEMAPHAYTEFNAWQKVNNDHINSLSEFDPRRAAISKMPSQLARITLILHEVMIHTGESRNPFVVDPETVVRAGMIADYFVANVDRVWQVLSESKPDRQARQLHTWLCRQAKSVTVREILRYGVAGFRSDTEAEGALRYLEAAGLALREKTVRTEKFTAVTQDGYLDE